MPDSNGRVSLRDYIEEKFKKVEELHDDVKEIKKVANKLPCDVQVERIASMVWWTRIHWTLTISLVGAGAWVWVAHAMGG